MKRIYLICLALILAISLSAEKRGVQLIKSLVIPGWSQISSGRDYGYVMLSSEVAIIGSMAFFNNESKGLMRESYEYAIKFAHLNPNHYDTEFYNHLARYESSGFDTGGYNAWVRKIALETYPYDPLLQQEYIDTHSYGDDKYWSWDDSGKRSEYNRLRNRSSDFKDYALVAGGVMLLNHLVSGIDVMRYTAKPRSSQLSFSVQDRTPLVNISYKF